MTWSVLAAAIMMVLCALLIVINYETEKGAASRHMITALLLFVAGAIFLLTKGVR